MARLARRMRYFPHTVEPTEIHACGAVSPITAPMLVEDQSGVLRLRSECYGWWSGAGSVAMNVAGSRIGMPA